eukprot:Protomagalhaensia_sp_Gyna_25__4968@NODE_53_length_6056_cov_78_686222_g40_i0_p7_GENE_NODE_53_length_6056_cov_78_686222_g40_i0NODE_53_length_6056_cov_78_686222_g40_i0_p7_ORF_typecomplete_len136_score12_90_NODE_53_length_6056_cov_78_686222_g40_i019692376
MSVEVPPSLQAPTIPLRDAQGVAIYYRPYQTVEKTPHGAVRQYHYVPPRKRGQSHKVIYQEPGRCGGCNDWCCGGGCCDRGDSVSKKRQGCCCGCNCNGCCNREKVWVRKGSSISSWQLRQMESVTLQKRKQGCC